MGAKNFNYELAKKLNQDLIGYEKEVVLLMLYLNMNDRLEKLEKQLSHISEQLSDGIPTYEKHF